MSYEARFWVTMALPVIVVLLTTVVFVLVTVVRAAVSACRPLRAEGTSVPGTLDGNARAASVLASATSLGSSGSTRSSSAASVTVSPRRATRTQSWGGEVSAALAQYVQERQFLVVLVVVLFLTYMPIVGLAVRSLECQDQQIGGVLYLQSDLTVECFAGSHVGVVIGAITIGFVAVGIGLPLSVVVALRGRTVSSSLEFMTRGYSKRLQWWESLVLVRKAALVMAAALVTDAASQTAAAILVLVAALWLQTAFRPFELTKHNTLEVVSLATMVLTATLSLVYLQAGGGEAAQASLAPGESSASLSGAVDAAVTTALLGTNAVVMGLLVMAACGPRFGLVTSRFTCCKRRRSTPTVQKKQRRTSGPEMVLRSQHSGNARVVATTRLILASKTSVVATKASPSPAKDRMMANPLAKQKVRLS
jgi:hypothetical protein